MKTIAFFISEIRRGGAERVLVNLANTFTSKGYSVIFITSHEIENEYVLDKKIIRFNIEKEKCNKIIKIYNEILDIRKICKKCNVDTLISFMANNNFKAIVSSLGVCKSIISIRNHPPKEYYNLILKISAALLYPLADRYVFQTDDEKKYFPRSYYKKSKVIYNPVSKDFYEKTDHICEKKNGIIAVGRLEPQKNYNMLIEAYHNLHELGCREKLLIYGSGSMYEDIKKKINSYKLNKCVKLMGNVNDIKSRIKDAKLFVMTSSFEGMPNALMEAMALGIPSVCTDALGGGPRELIVDGENGFLVKRDDIEELVNKINILIKNTDIQRKFSINARQTANKFSEDMIFVQWEQMVLDLRKE